MSAVESGIAAPHDANAETLYELLVLQARYEAVGIISLVLVDPEGRELAPWQPGSHIDVILRSGLVRQYSLCGDLDDVASYRIAVLLEPDSRGGSKEIHESGLVGRTLTVRGPRNHFHLEPAENYLFLAGGIGVTPIVPMLQRATADGVPWRLVYGGRNRKTMGFLEHLESLKGGSVELVPEDELGFPDFERLLNEAPVGVGVYGCGPAGMLAALEEHCARLRPGALHIERFTAPEPEATNEPGINSEFEVELRRTGTILTVPADTSLLGAIRQVLPHVLYACEEGYCGTCETRVLEGIPDHRDVILTDAEKARNDTMLICVGRSCTPRLVLDL